MQTWCERKFSWVNPFFFKLSSRDYFRKTKKSDFWPLFQDGFNCFRLEYG